MPCHHSSFFPLFLLLLLQISRITAQAGPTPQVTITISSQVLVVDPTHIVLNNKTVSPSGSPIKVNGQTVSADAYNDLFVDGVEVITVSGDTNLGIPVAESTSTASNRTKATSDSKESSSNPANITARTFTAQSGASTGSLSTSTQASVYSISNSNNTHSTTSLSSSGRISSESPRSGSLTSNLNITHTTKSGSSYTSTSNQNSSPYINITSDTSPSSSVYTIDGVTWTGNPSIGLTAATATITPGGQSVVISSHTFALPSSATGGVISVDGKPTKLLLPSAQSFYSDITHSGSSDTAGGLGVGFGPVGSITLSDASTTVTYNEVVLTKYSTIQTPTVIVTDFPEFDSKGSTTLVHGSIIVGNGGTVLIHPPSPPPGSGSIGPPGFGGPIRPPSGSSGCPSFFGISFCPPSINIEPPGSTDVDPDDLPDGIDPNNPDDSENNETERNTSQEHTTTSKDQTSSSDHETSTKSTASGPSSVSATTTGSLTTSRASTSSSRSSTGSISSSASSSSESCSASGCGCVTLSYAPDSTPDPLDDDSNETRKRRLAGRFLKNKREDNYASAAASKIGGASCAVSRYLVRPLYPGPAIVTNNEGGNPAPSMVAFYQTATYWAVPTKPPKCGAPGWEFVDTAGLSNKVIGGPWQVGGEGKAVNIDHVYEVSLLDEFFSAQLGAGFTCADITALFDVNDGSTGGTRLNTIFGQLASLMNPDFLGMDSSLNRLKGALWNPNLQGANLGCTNSNACIQSLSNIAVVMAMANDDKVKALFSATNGRIYAAFKGVDDLITAQEGCANPLKGENGDPIQATWADAYSTWMTNKVKSNNDLITKTASEISASISTDVAAAPKKKQGNVRNWSAFVSNFNVAYTTVDSLTFPQPTLWPNNALGIQKRADATQGAACSKSLNPGTSATAGSTTKSALSSTVTKPPSTSPILASITSQGFTCTGSLKNPVDPDYPCLCEDFTYCAQSTGSPCGWTTTPAAENCCQDCF